VYTPIQEFCNTIIHCGLRTHRDAAAGQQAAAKGSEIVAGDTGERIMSGCSGGLQLLESADDVIHAQDTVIHVRFVASLLFRREPSFAEACDTIDLDNYESVGAGGGSGMAGAKCSAQG
jgi:hypothetical protein